MAGSNSQTYKQPDNWWAVPADELARRVAVDLEEGPNPDQVGDLRTHYGRNEIGGIEPTSTWELLWESVTSPMILLLLAVAGISLALGQHREAVVMTFVVLTYVGVELLNKRRTDRTLARLRELQAPRADVIRGGERHEVRVDEVVVGDVLPLQPGSRVAADGRLIFSAGLLVDEAPLTGESAAQSKDAEAEVAPDAELAERPTAVFAGTTVLDGQGKALVVAVGGETELGRVAELTAATAEDPTPLQQEMDELARVLAYVAVGVSLLIPFIGLLRGYDFEQMVLTWLSLTFLMVPGQPPIIITMALALAAFELAKKEVVVKRLRGAETLGSVTSILSDKTGTMTQNKMELASLILGDGSVLAWQERGENDTVWRAFMEKALPAIPEGSKNPTDVALVEASTKLDLRPEPGRLVDQSGFAQEERYRSLTYERSGERRRYATGGPEFALRACTHWQRGDEVRDFSEGQKEGAYESVEKLAGQGQRIVGYAYGAPSEEEPEDMILAGCPALKDPIREGVGDAIARLKGAGVRTVMVTGDNAATAREVARRVGLDDSVAITGKELEETPDEDLEKTAGAKDVFARVTPEGKLRLAEALKRQGEVVAVTGDGVNDAPALRTAHIGIAMGITGTDVAREAADLVLTDDDFSHLPEGVAIGRKAYDNFRKGLTYYLSAKAILLAAFLVPLAVGRPFPFAPIQIIAIELLMDLASSTIFITEAAEPGLMEQEPRRQRGFLSWKVGLHILRNLIGPTLAILAAYFGSLSLGHDLASARTAAFATWLLGHIVLALVLKQERISLFSRGLLANKFAAGWLVGMIALVAAMVYVPFVREALGTASLNPTQWALVIGGALAGGGWLEIIKSSRERPARILLR